MFRKLIVFCVAQLFAINSACADSVPDCGNTNPGPSPNTALPMLMGRVAFQSPSNIYVADFGAQIPATALVFSYSSAPPTPVALDTPRNPNWSPDGRWLVFSAVANNRRDIYIARPDGSHLVNLSADQSASDPYEDARFTPDGEHIIFKDSYKTNMATNTFISRILVMTVSLPGPGVSGDPVRTAWASRLPWANPAISLPDDGITQYSGPVISITGKYLYYFASVGNANAGVFRANLYRGGLVSVAADPNIQSYYPNVRDQSSTLYTSWLNTTNAHKDQIFLYSPQLLASPLYFSWNDPNYDDSDPIAVDDDNIIYSSNRCVINNASLYKLYLGQVANARYWPLSAYNLAIDDVQGDLRGASYTPFPAGP